MTLLRPQPITPVDTAGGRAENKRVQLKSSDPSWCRNWSEKAAWGSDLCLCSTAWLLGCGHHECDGDVKLAGGGSAQLVH